MGLALVAAVVFAYMTILWSLSIRRGDPSFIDAAWGFGFVVIAAVTFVTSVDEGDATRRWLLFALTAAWGLRLGGYLLWRWRRNGPDPRYAAMLRRVSGNPHVFTLTRVFWLQGALMWIVSLPVQLGQRTDEPRGLTITAAIGTAIVIVGLAFETTADAQLVAFKADQNNAGRVLDRGLWRYSRHPNYFGDALVWWGLFLVAVVDAPTAVSVIGPIVMTTLLLRYSGVPILERGLRRRRPGYDDYVARTSTFVPRRPRTTSPDQRTS